MSTDGYFADAELFGTCSYYHYDTQQEHDKPIIKKKSKYEIFLLTLLSPIYIVGLLIYGVFSFAQFLTQGGLFGLLIIGWIISFIYHFFFTFLPFLFNVVA